ncbi:hypothetical protein M408DRAFT_29353 [Serendipita vermifera MAFF 305830]|uniref:Uncharacterized protein n=1 Tax=Serendipita vermifera MAFF 305830 TaxID=933852 RepID=A0A0C2WWH6_SERVB|nr:hypothetical protein M408DRAFT_29353 [Serendipita vermifera MAFF 305830]
MKSVVQGTLDEIRRLSPLTERGTLNEKLIAAIHRFQVERLCVTSFKAKVFNIIQRLPMVVAYLDFQRGPDANPGAATRLGKSIIKDINTANSAVDFSALAAQLETQDRASGAHTDDNLTRDDVVSQAKALFA